MNTTTAILFFSKTARAEATSKTIVPHSKAVNQHFLDTMILHGRQVVKNTGLPFYIFSQHQQQGYSFGEKISHAIQWVFNQGHNEVIVLGNDCPAISVGLIKQACYKLQTGSTVIGPNARGGIYLLGLTRQAFDAGAVCHLPWQTSALAEAITVLYGKNIETLPQFNDVNGSSDLPFVINDLCRSSRLSALINDLIRRTFISLGQVFTTACRFVFAPGLRAPPCLAL